MVFTEAQCNFLKAELGLSFKPNTPIKIAREKWLKIKDDVFWIEAEESERQYPLNERGRIAVSICDIR